VRKYSILTIVFFKSRPRTSCELQHVLLLYPPPSLSLPSIAISNGNEGVLTLSGEGDLLLHSGELSLEHGNLSLSRGDIEVLNGGVHVSGGSGVAITAGGPRTPSSSGSSRVAQGLSVSLMATDGVDSELAALGFGGNVGGSNSPLGVSFEHQSLLTVGAPPVTMADLMGSEGGNNFQPNRYSSVSRSLSLFFSYSHTLSLYYS